MIEILYAEIDGVDNDKCSKFEEGAAYMVSLAKKHGKELNDNETIYYIKIEQLYH